VLRNSLSAASTLWTSLQLAWSWRATAEGYVARTLPTIISAILALSAFTVAGGFTSSISTGIGNEVLINGSQCAVAVNQVFSADTLFEMYPWVSQKLNNVANYAQQCYSMNTSTGILDCTTFVKGRLPFSATLNASCPFSGDRDNDMCLSNDSNLLLDSGLISSEDLGLNMPSSQKMFYREVLHCAPLRTDGFTSDITTNYSIYTRYWYGASPSIINVRNWTFEVENIEAEEARESQIWPTRNLKGFSVM
jgi:hypothetical protein